MKAELAKLEFLRAHDAHRLDLSALPPGRRRMLAETGRRATNQAFQRADVDRRYPILLATLAETYVEVLDELVQLLDQALAGADSRARHEQSQRVVERARNEIERGRLLDEVLDVLADPTVPDEQAGRLIRARIGMPRLRAALRLVADREPRDHGHFDLLAARYKYLRTFTPAVIGQLTLTGNTLHEYGRLVRTIYLCRYLSSEELRRKVRRQLNKGESLHALRRDLFVAHQGHVRRRHLDDQVDQALCLTVVTNAAVLSTTTYIGDALDALHATDRPVADEAAAHLTPAQHDHINFYGTYSFDVEAELRRQGHRPLRSPSS